MFCILNICCLIKLCHKSFLNGSKHTQTDFYRNLHFICFFSILLLQTFSLSFISSARLFMESFISILLIWFSSVSLKLESLRFCIMLVISSHLISKNSTLSITNLWHSTKWFTSLNKLSVSWSILFCESPRVFHHQKQE